MILDGSKKDLMRGVSRVVVAFCRGRSYCAERRMPRSRGELKTFGPLIIFQV